MDRRLRAITAVIALEIILRSAYAHVAMDPLLYTLLARSAEMLLMLMLAFSECGIISTSLSRELLVGAASACAFGGAVLLVDLIARLVISGGLLRLLLVAYPLENPFMFVFVGCIVAPLAEELFFRGLCYAWLRRRLPLIVSLSLSALMFACMHGFIAPVQLIGGLAFGALYEWRQNIWAAYVLHATANFGIWAIPSILPCLSA